MDQKHQFLRDWAYLRNNTQEYLKSVPDDRLTFSSHPEWGSIGRHLRHMGDVQECYLNALDTGKLSFKAKRKDRSMESNKQKLAAYFRELDEKLEKKINTMGEQDFLKPVEWKEFDNPTVEATLTYMKEHEVFHQGILQVYAKLANFHTIRFF